MGDIFSLAHSLNLSAVNTVLLVALYVILKNGFWRIQQLERKANRNAISIAVIKQRLQIVEEHDDN